ncbi:MULTISPECIES: lipopolysaccharide assembly protein LapB [Marinobacter]|uniref:Lipopolysaccharide assembly protein B n=1 Tax=Marinobacter nauticus TaxID=2743 RepID=A0A833JN94_MARNT|nr:MULTISPECIES: lipopolysaccharide assembly protein LapB [Marinobacter]MEC8824131.1 lipopolysaccharide assembly protein LapB [Pseudomonadota bacterium]KAE8544977.1 Lipopolysaccharide assembly protein LapB [Marinobacter nauticus]MAC22979.1 lipopolysaccharide assembly protein LapB [Marinobacter sp.]MEC9041315.1 lipopolysaccharide assembly protein LapB [Pseudomonadota bacterium]MEC9085179.1 lipopolysaccharide assembly protein LapB [Pseudomonadota bacterium]|tara:strand:+ start:6918 stop:8090 length:1173 start_codon:yes stop_codon:yes gene_type:complete
MDMLFQWLLLTAAVAAGWAVGRYGNRSGRASRAIMDEDSVRDRLQFLFTNYSDQAVENFVQSLAVNKDTVSLHLSIGSHFRNKGETDRAILIHQNLLARPELPARYSPQVTQELAMDYLNAGLLDRAEALFHQLMGDREYGRRSAIALIELYQQEREWEKAAQVAKTLTRGDADPATFKALAYITCELSDGALSRNDDRWTAQKLAKEALDYDRSCVRATLLLMKLQIRQGNFREAANQSLKIFDQNPEFGPEAIDRLMKLEREHGDVSRLYKKLRKLYEQYPSTSLLLALVESVERSSGRPAGIDLLRMELETRPSVRGLLRLVEMAGYEKGMTTDEGRLVSRIGHLILANRPVYRCVSCGFSGQQLHWLCPSCKQWETVRPIQGVEAE